MMAKKMRITRIVGPTDVNGEALLFQVVDKMPEKIWTGHAVSIIEAMHVCGGDVSGYVVTSWDHRRIEVNGSKLESVEWTEDKR